MRPITDTSIPPLRALLTAILILSMTACGALRREPPIVDRSRDSQIIRDVQARLTAEPAIDASRIRVEADGGLVLLYGSVDGMGQWHCAIRNAQLVDGVRSVVDYLVIERGPRDIVCGAPRDST